MLGDTETAAMSAPTCTVAERSGPFPNIPTSVALMPVAVNVLEPKAAVVAAVTVSEASQSCSCSPVILRTPSTKAKLPPTQLLLAKTILSPGVCPGSTVSTSSVNPIFSRSLSSSSKPSIKSKESPLETEDALVTRVILGGAVTSIE